MAERVTISENAALFYGDEAYAGQDVKVVVDYGDGQLLVKADDGHFVTVDRDDVEVSK